MRINLKKKCNDCKKRKLFTEFSKSLLTFDGLQGICKACARKRQQKRNKARQRLRTLKGEELLKQQYGGADVWLHGQPVMKNGVLEDTKLAREWRERLVKKFWIQAKYRGL